MNRGLIIKRVVVLILIQSLVLTTAVGASVVKLDENLDRGFKDVNSQCENGTLPSNNVFSMNSIYTQGDSWTNSSTGGRIPFLMSTPDTVETYEIEIEEESKSNRLKEMAVFVVVVAVVGYIVIVMMQPEDEEEKSTPPGSGKPVPFGRVPIYSISF